MAGLKIALVGAESTGKSVLAQDLAPRLTADTGLTVAVVPEFLRHWCEQAGRTPRPEEQAAIAAEQARQIRAAAARHELVLCDTTPLMVAIYSQQLFDDASLLPAALEFQRGCALTLLTTPDLPWVADGMRDGAHVQAPVDAALRRALLGAGLSWSIVSGRGPARLDAALNAITPLLLRRRSGAQALPGHGLFTRLQARQDALPEQAWFCQDCDVPECEHAMLQRARRR